MTDGADGNDQLRYDIERNTMQRCYADIYLSRPLLNIDVTPLGSKAMSVQHFQARPYTTPEELFTEHHVLLDLGETPSTGVVPSESSSISEGMKSFTTVADDRAAAANQRLRAN